MLGTRRHKRRVPLGQLEPLCLDVEHATSIEHDVDLVVLVRLLPVRLRSNEDVDVDLHGRRVVDDLVTAAPRLEPRPDAFDIERLREGQAIPAAPPPGLF
jgi:hypothetical protein